jgi:hypothetical protein
MELSGNVHAPVPIPEGKTSVTYGRCYMDFRKIMNLRAERIIVGFSGVELQKSNPHLVAVHGTVHCITLERLGAQTSPYFLFMAQQTLVDQGLLIIEISQSHSHTTIGRTHLNV